MRKSYILALMIYHKFSKFVKKLGHKITKERALIGLGVIMLTILATNALTLLLYKNKTYPNTKLNNVSMANIHFAELPKYSREIIHLPDSLSFKIDSNSRSLTPQEIGISVNYDQITKSIKTNRHWLPIINLFTDQQNSGQYVIDSNTFENGIKNINNELKIQPSDASIVIKDNSFAVSADQPGREIDLERSQETIIAGLKNNQSDINMPTKETPVKITENSLLDQLHKLQASSNTKISLKFNDKSLVISKSEITNLYLANGNDWQPSSSKINSLIDAKSKQFGLIAGNKKQASEAILSALTKNKSAVITLVAEPKLVRTYSYCVAAKGVDTKYLGAFRSKLQAVYADTRGWSADGKFSFKEVTSGCNYTAWLTAADLVPSFSSTICDNIWSCRVGNNVIINFDRWSNASPAWNDSGAGLDEYRSMVINHETGHWLGFRHRFCSGAGQLAPVMQQQSISLQSCKFNAWPTSGELADHKR